MYSPLCVLLLLYTPSTLPALEPGAQLKYSGRFVAERGEPGTPEKTFQLSLFVSQKPGDKLTVYWTLEEQGYGSWSWLDSFGRTHVGRSATDHQSAGPALLYVRPQGTNVVPIQFPLPNLPETIDELGVGTRWNVGQLDYRVEQADRVADRDTWQVAVTNAYGRQQTLWIDKQTRIIVAAEKTVFIGQGEKHLLQFALASQQVLPAAKRQPTIAAFDVLLQLKAKLGIAPRTRNVVWNQARLSQLDQHLAQLEKQSAVQPLTKLLQAAARDAKQQEYRSSALASVKTRLVGKPAPQPKLTDLRGREFDWQQTKGKVTVLHFWEYRDVPLEEPYGQTAYVDFLYRNREPDQVAVLGIAVDDRLSDPTTRSDAIRGIKKLRSFMNLSYPILIDAGQAIRQYGDPRAAGSKLPLFVVVEGSGKIAHYHVGYYEVHRDRGLEELDQVIKQILANRE